MWLLLLCVHLVGLIGFNLFLRKSVGGKLDRYTMATLAQTGIAVPSMFILLAHPTEVSKFSASAWWLVAAAILLTIALQVTNSKALQYLEASVFSILYNLRLILTTVLGVLFLNEDIVGLRILGGIFILFAIFIVRQRSSKSIRFHGIVWGVTAAFVLSFLNLCEKELINHVGFINYFPIVSVLTALIMWTYLLISGRRVERRLLLRKDMLQLMTFRAMSAYGFSGALAAGALISVANYISGMNVIFMVLIGAVWLNERDYLKRKVVATVIAVFGLTLVFLSRV